ncbi:hypothetical protein [Phormidesmis sp. 146-33]
MAKVKMPLRGEQIALPLEHGRPGEMTAASPFPVRFLLLQRGKDVPWMGLALAQNDRYLRVRYVEAGQMRESDVPRQRLLSLKETIVKVEVNKAEAFHDEMARLEQERDRLKAEGTIALPGCWIETGVVKGRQFRQAWWRSGKAMFPSKRVPGEMVKTCYIGEEGGMEHQEAIAARKRRNRLKWVDRRLSKLLEGV